jgi:phage-Barnase-EndoU-ColicinE5/D-RelE like nuclease2/Phage Mu protein F like protein
MKGASAQYLSLPFTSAIGFFRDKVALPTQAWDDLWQGMHSRAFVVAGATRADLLLDMRSAVDRAISKGTTLADFRHDFDSIVDRYGWAYKGNRNWRSAVIYDTNLSVAYAAGHHKAMTDPAVLAVRPYWRYLPSSAANPREEHRRWYNLILPHDDPFWKTHRPPNGWGCHCGLGSVSEREFARLRKEEAGGRYPIHSQAPTPEDYDYVDRKTGVVTQVPVGIDPGWDYNPGAAAWGAQQSKKAMGEFDAMKGDVWEQLTSGNYATYGLPGPLAADQALKKLGPPQESTAAVSAALADLFDGPEKIYTVTSDGFRYDVLVNAEALAKHMDLDQAQYVPLLPEALGDPQEIWLRFEKHRASGRVVLSQRAIKALKTEDGQTLTVIADARNGMLESLEVQQISDWEALNKQRVGTLIYKKAN